MCNTHLPFFQAQATKMTLFAAFIMCIGSSCLNFDPFQEKRGSNGEEEVVKVRFNNAVVLCPTSNVTVIVRTILERWLMMKQC